MTLVNDKDLYETLKKLDVITGKDLDAALESAQQTHQPLSTILLERELIADDNLGKIVADLMKIPFIDLSKLAISDEVLRIVPEVVAKRQKIMPFEKNKVIKLAMADPSNKEIITFLEKKTGEKIEVYYATSTDISRAIGSYKKNLQQSFDDLLKEKVKEAKEAGTPAAAEAPVTQILDLLIEYAYENRASDIHIEPEETESVIRFRVDGILHDVLHLPTDLHDQLVSRVKVASKLKTDEHLSAQDGKMIQKIPDEDLDIRVSVVPITKGEKIVMRLLSSKSRQFSLADLGMRDSDVHKVKDGFTKPYGMVLATGPTGCGKTTTVYAILKILNNRDVNIATIEDPVEYDIQGINQIQVNPKTNLTFASGLKSILRQDPNIIFVGEIRDEETAGIATNSATTGHLVLSTLHTNNAATTLPRLIDMKVEPYLVASTVNVIVAQRLVRKICLRCRTSIELKISDLNKSFSEKVLKHQFGNSEKIQAYIGKGCPVCNKTGYVGRVGIFEVLVVSPAVREKIVAKATANEITDLAVSEGMTTMQEDGLQKVQLGVTTIEEVLKATED